MGTPKQYADIQDNPLYIYISKSIFGTIAKIIPSWLHPNLLTLSTLLISHVSLALFSYYDYYFFASSQFYSEHPPIPANLWLFLSLAMLLEYLIDGIDGVHARNLGVSSVLGEFLDHATDIPRMTLCQPLCMFSMFGRADIGLTPYEMLACLVSIQFITLSTFCLQAVSGVLFLPWNYEISNYFLITFYFITWFRGGSHWWRSNLYFPSFDNSRIILYGVIVSCIFISFPIQLYSFWRAHQQGLIKINKSLSPVLIPITSNGVLLASTLLWCSKSSKRSLCIINQDPRMFFCGFGLTFMNICVHTLLGRLQNRYSVNSNWLTLFYAICASSGLVLAKTQRWMIWYILAGYALVAVFHYAWSFIQAIRWLSVTHNIPCFVVSHKAFGETKKRQ